MKYRLLLAVLIFIVFITSCSKNDNSNTDDEDQSKEFVELQKEKLHELANLKKEVELLKSKKDSVIEKYNQLVVKPKISKIILKSDLDHMNIAVRNLETTEKYFSELLGFTIKKGRKHNNGLVNSFIKFEDGTYIEFITTQTESDSSKSAISELLTNGDRGAFVSLKSDSIISLSNYYKLMNKTTVINNYGNAFETLEFGENEKLTNVFFVNYLTQAKDEPVLYIHKNGAISLNAVWMAADDLKDAGLLFSSYGYKVLSSITIPSLNIEGMAVELNTGKILLLPHSGQKGIFGITLLVKNINETRGYLEKSLNTHFKIYHGVRGKTILLTPEITHNIFIELLEKEYN